MAKPVTQDEHVLDNGEHCPICGSDAIEGDACDFNSGKIEQEMWCLICDSAWLDVYHLKGYSIVRNTKE